MMSQPVQQTPDAADLAVPNGDEDATGEASHHLSKQAPGDGSGQIVGAATADAAARPRDGVLANRDFVKLWAGETVSLIGTQVTQFAMPLVAILTLNATVFQVGVLNALRFLPLIPLSLLAGVLLDRRRRRPVLICCALGNALLIGLVPLSSVTGLLSIGLLYVVTTLVGMLSMTFEVGALSYVPFLVERRHLPEANGKLQASFAVAGISGPGLAGLLVGLITAPITLSVDAVSYLFSAASLISIRKSEPHPDRPAERSSIRRSIAEGLHTVYGSKLLRALLAQSAALNLCYAAVVVVFVVYAVRILGLSPFKLGIVVGAAAVGGLAGALLATRFVRVLGFGRAMAVSTLGVSAGPLMFMIPRGAGPVSMAILIAAQLTYGCSIAIFNVNAITLRQTVTPQRLLARMNATYRMVIYGVPLLGAMAGGLLGSAVGLRPALVISLVAMLSPVLWIFFSPVYRLRAMPQEPPLGQRMDEAHE
jgi:MFS family permease